MLKYLVIPAMIAIASCGQNSQNSEKTKTEKQSLSIDSIKINQALTFINAYVENATNMKPSDGLLDWLNKDTLTTTHFKVELTKLITDAFEKDPELGLGSDPMFDAQDYPENGFELNSFDEKTNYVTVKGIGWPEFKLTISVAEENGSWLVDGCGIVNIPVERRAKR